MNTLTIEEIYFIVDEIAKEFSKKYPKIKKAGRKAILTHSETLAILVIGNMEGLSTNKQIYNYIKNCFSRDFNLPCYGQFTRAIRNCSPLINFAVDTFARINIAKEPGTHIIDSTALPVSSFNPTGSVKWCYGDAAFSKNMHGFYFGFKLHIIVNNDLEIVSAIITSANVADSSVLKNDKFVSPVKGVLVGDKGYQTKDCIKHNLRKKGIEMIAKQRDNMDPYLNIFYAALFKKRRKIERIFGNIKQFLAPIFRFSRCVKSFIAHVSSSLFSYMLKHVKLEKLSSLGINLNG